MMSRVTGWLLLAAFLGQTVAAPLEFSLPQAYHDPEGRPRAVLSDLGGRLGPHALHQEAGLQAGRLGQSTDSRLGLPSPQEIDAIKKVAQILIMLGEQVIPTIIGDIAVPPPPPPPAHPASCNPCLVEDAPNDPVADN